jgi:hypothetical protein
MSDQTTIAFVLDNPNEAAEELERLRQLRAWLIINLTSAHKHLLAPIPENLEPYQQHGEYAERCGYARGTIAAALDELKK